MAKYPRVELRVAAADRVRRGHPWVFKNGLERGLRGAPGEAVVLTDHMQTPLAVGISDSSSDLAVRVFGGPDEILDERFFAKRIAAAQERRLAWGVRNHSSAYRLLHGENDFLPGFVVDVYDRTAVLKLDGPYEAWLPAVTSALAATGEIDGIVYRAETPKTLWGNVTPEIAVREHDYTMLVDVIAGQKTGTFLDQRDNRRWVSEHAAGKNILNLYCYTGGFSLAALAGGAEHVTSVDIAAPAIKMLEKSLLANQFERKSHTSVTEDCYAFMKKALEQHRRWDLIVLDPPSLGHSQAAMPKARKAYERLNVAAMRVLEPGGMFCTSSCTSRMTAEDFRNMVQDAAEHAGRKFQIIYEGGAGADHPISLAFPEGRYLKFLALQAD